MRISYVAKSTSGAKLLQAFVGAAAPAAGDAALLPALQPHSTEINIIDTRVQSSDTFDC